MRDYDTTVARMAGNIAAGASERLWKLGLIEDPHARKAIARLCVLLSLDIVDEVRLSPSVGIPSREDTHER